MKNYVYAVAFAMTLGLSACSSSDDNPTTAPPTTTPPTTAPQPADSNTPVTGEFHGIKPADVDAYIANFEAQKARISFTFDGTAHPLTFIEEDSENKALVAGYDDKVVVIGFDLENEKPLPTLALVQGEGDNITNQWEGRDLNIETTAEEDFVYTGRLKHSVSGEEFDVTLVFNEALIAGGTSTLTVSGTDALLNGDMGTGTYIQMRDMIAANPAVNRVVIQQSSGSVNDDINVHTGRLIRAANLATHVPADGDINSGAVDLFASGVSRTVEPGGKLGVHSWCCVKGVTADKLPKNSPAHGIQLTYFREMLPTTGVDFYFFTLQAAPFTTVHVMTREEMTKYALVTDTNTNTNTNTNDDDPGNSICIGEGCEDANAATFALDPASNTVLIMNGVIDSSTNEKLEAMLGAHPIDTIRMVNVPGSMDDEANIAMAKSVSGKNLTISIADNGEVASGGVDLFLAGAKRTMGKNVLFGVHSWADGAGTQALELYKNNPSHEAHRLYIDYYDQFVIGLKDARPENDITDPGTDFYVYTLEAAPASSLHCMSAQEIVNWGIVTDTTDPSTFSTQTKDNSAACPN